MFYNDADMGVRDLLALSGIYAVYHRGDSTYTIRVFQAKTDWLQTITTGKMNISSNSADWICLFSDLPGEPKVGDFIVVPWGDDSRTWYVSNASNSECWRYMSPRSAYVRVHTKEGKGKG